MKEKYIALIFCILIPMLCVLGGLALSIRKETEYFVKENIAPNIKDFQSNKLHFYDGTTSVITIDNVLYYSITIFADFSKYEINISSNGKRELITLYLPNRFSSKFESNVENR